MWHGATRQISDNELLLRSIYDILKQISNDFSMVVQCRQTDRTTVASGVDMRCKPSFVPQMFSSFVFYPPSLSFCRRSANVCHVH